MLDKKRCNYFHYIAALTLQNRLSKKACRSAFPCLHLPRLPTFCHVKEFDWTYSPLILYINLHAWVVFYYLHLALYFPAVHNENRPATHNQMKATYLDATHKGLWNRVQCFPDAALFCTSLYVGSLISSFFSPSSHTPSSSSVASLLFPTPVAIPSSYITLSSFIFMDFISHKEMAVAPDSAHCNVWTQAGLWWSLWL